MRDSQKMIATDKLSRINRDELVTWYKRNRERSRAIFDLLADDETYYSQPIALRHPIVFYDGHLPGFSFNTLIKGALGGPSIDPALEALFARGIDPAEAGAHAGDPDRNRKMWPSREVVRQFVDEADRRVLDALATADLERPGHPYLDRAEAAFTILEHEAMHQETLLYMWHRLPLEKKRRPEGYRPDTGSAPPPVQEWIEVPAGRAVLGVDRHEVRFGWDNEHPAYAKQVSTFSVERFDVTNQAFFEFVEAGGYRDQQWWVDEDWQWIQAEGIEHPLFWEQDDKGWHWRGMFDRVTLPPGWPVYVTLAEAAAYARWKGARLMTEAEFQRAAYGTADDGQRPTPWGDAAVEPRHGVFDFVSWDPQPVGTHPDGRSAFGLDDIVGNGWEWTSTVFAPFDGFAAMASYPQYSADFFDGEHFVIKGASPVTARELLRPSFRNWFRPRYPYMYATFRCVRERS